MAMSDPIADLLTRIRNAVRAGHEHAYIPWSRLKEDICKVLRQEGYIEEYSVAGEGVERSLRVTIRYAKDGKPVITQLRRISKPSLRVYVKGKEIQQVRSGLGISIISTSHGLMTGRDAYRQRVGGEVICEVW